MRYFITTAVFAVFSVFAGAAQAQLADEVGSIGNLGTTRGGAPAVCTDAAIVTSDDGTAENGYGGNPAVVLEVTAVDQFDAADFPDSAIDTVCLGWVSLGPTDITFEIVVFDDDGAGGAPGTELGSVPGSASGLPTGLPETIVAFDVSAAGITLPASGNFYIGVRFVPTDPNFFIAADETGATNAGAGQLILDTGDPGDDWQPINGVFVDYSALIVRALPGVGEPPPPPVSQSVPTLSNLGLVLMSLVLAAIALVALRIR